MERGRRESLEVEVKWLRREMGELIESLQTTMIEVDDLKRDKEEYELML